MLVGYGRFDNKIVFTQVCISWMDFKDLKIEEKYEIEEIEDIRVRRDIRGIRGI